MSKDSSKQIHAIQRWIKEVVEEIRNIRRASFRRTLLYSIIDSFAHSWKSYTTHDADAVFQEFLIQFSSEKNRSILLEVCPVVLYNRYKHDYPMGMIQLPSYCTLFAGDEALRKEANRLLSCIRSEKEAEEIKGQCTYCSLLYADRKVSVHGLIQVGSPPSFAVDYGMVFPYVESDAVLEDDEEFDEEFDEETILDANWSLHIPEAFIINLLFDTVNGYLDYCATQHISPIINDRGYRL